MELTDKERRYISLDEEPFSVEDDGITFQFKDGTVWFIPAQEFYELLMFVVELKSASEKRRREVLG